MTGLQNGQSLGLTGFGASGHLVLMMASYRFPRTRIFVFARSPEQRDFAISLGADWAGEKTARSPEKPNAIIDTTLVWQAVIAALENLAPGGRLAINVIRKEKGDKKSLLGLDYPRHLWMEKEIKSVANITRSDVSGFLALAADANFQPKVEEYPLEATNEALVKLKFGKNRGVKVLVMK